MSADSFECAARWRIHPLVQLHWRRWEDEWAVFDVGSGQTHQMDMLTAVSLLLLEGEPNTPAQLAASIAAELGTDGSPTFAAALDDVLERLSTAGLIEPA